MNGQCIFNDDFGQLRPHLVTADMVVFATPMYYFGFSSQLKAVIDRFYALNGQVKGSEKRSALLMAYADTAAEEAEPMLSALPYAASVFRMERLWNGRGGGNVADGCGE